MNKCGIGIGQSVYGQMQMHSVTVWRGGLTDMLLGVLVLGYWGTDLRVSMFLGFGSNRDGGVGWWVVGVKEGLQPDSDVVK